MQELIRYRKISSILKSVYCVAPFYELMRRSLVAFSYSQDSIMHRQTSTSILLDYFNDACVDAYTVSSPLHTDYMGYIGSKTCVGWICCKFISPGNILTKLDSILRML